MKKIKIFILAAVVIVSAALAIFLSIKPHYNLVYCEGSDTVSLIQVVNGRLVEPERKDGLAPEAYDYGFYMLDTSNFSKKKLTVQDVNNLHLIVSPISPDGFYITRRELIDSHPKGYAEGLFRYEVFLTKLFLKTKFGEEKQPTHILKEIGWVAK